MVHEWSLAEAVARYISENYRDKKIVEIHLGLGELQNIDEEIFSFALKEILRSEGYNNFDLVIRRVPISLRCRSCGFSWSISKEDLSEELAEIIHFLPEAIHSYMRCPKCGSRDFAIISGRGVYIEKIVLGESK
jgi:hydrogenase nickel incorporation protein HypA/HybF